MAHIVLVTKFRNKCLNNEILTKLEEIIGGILNNWNCNLIELNSEVDHVHLLINYEPSLSLTKLITNLKSVSSRKLRHHYYDHFKKYYWKPILWSSSYGVCSVGETNKEVIENYIRNQDRPTK